MNESCFMQDVWIGEAAPALAAVIDPSKLGTSLDDLRSKATAPRASYSSS